MPRPPSPTPLAFAEEGESFSFEEVAADELVYNESLGRGCTAEVFRGFWRGREVAIKEIFHQRKDSRSGKSVKMDISFNREVSVLSKVRHPHLVQFIGVCFEPRPLRVVIEFCKGGSLFDLVHDEDLAIHLAQQIKMCKDIAEGMCYLHNFKPQIIHRDLKSLNLLLVEPVLSGADKPHIKVSDFGTARMKDLETEWGSMTKAAGTCHWMAPEVFKGPYDEMADVYSYAMVLYEIICRDVPFDECEGNEVLSLVLEGVRPSMDLVPADSPPALVELMTSCWAQNPAARPTFARVLELLSPIAAGAGPA